MKAKLKNMLKNNMVLCVLILIAICLSSVVLAADFKIKQGKIKEGVIFGSWTTTDSNSTTLAEDNVYRATSDGFMSFSASNAGTGTFGYTDSSNPPTTAVVGSDAINSPEAGNFPVKAGEYCRVSTSNGTFSGSIRWLPIGSGSLVKQ